MLIEIITSIAAFSSGVVTGGALAAVIALVGFIPRLINLTESHKFLNLYENLFIAGTLLFSFAYFLNFYTIIHTVFVMILGLIFGTFLGIFNAVLAETLNVIPIIAKKFKMKKILNLYSILWL